jgi:hypothetical protein
MSEAPAHIVNAVAKTLIERNGQGFTINGSFHLAATYAASAAMLAAAEYLTEHPEAIDETPYPRDKAEFDQAMPMYGGAGPTIRCRACGRALGDAHQKTCPFQDQQGSRRVDRVQTC